MKKNVFLYLFILAVLCNVFTFMYFSKRDIVKTDVKVESSKQLRDSLGAVESKLSDANYFSLENNQNAQDYLYNANSAGMTYEQLIPYVKDKLMDYNNDSKGNPYTGQDQLGAQKFIMNKAKVLNHRWIIADYSDGEYWGEVLLKYFINDDKSVSFEVIQSIIYPKQKAE